MVITSESELRTAYRKPNDRAEQKMLGWLTNHSRKFIAISPFCVISSFGADGRADTSPKGDPPGSWRCWTNGPYSFPTARGIIRSTRCRTSLSIREVGLLFMVPGMNETLRVSGTAEIVTDAELLEPLSVGSRPPLSGLRVTVEEAFLHCGRSLIRSRLWDPEVQIDHSSFPTYGQVLADQIKNADAKEIDASEDEANRHRLY